MNHEQVDQPLGEQVHKRPIYYTEKVLDGEAERTPKTTISDFNHRFISRLQYFDFLIFALYLNADSFLT